MAQPRRRNRTNNPNNAKARYGAPDMGLAHAQLLSSSPPPPLPPLELEADALAAVLVDPAAAEEDCAITDEPAREDDPTVLEPVVLAALLDPDTANELL